MCLAWGGVGGEVGEWMKGLGLGFNNPLLFIIYMNDFYV